MDQGGHEQEFEPVFPEPEGGDVLACPGRATTGHGVQLQQELARHRHQRRFLALAALT